MNQKFKLDVNGKTHTVDADPDMPLLYALRDRSRIEQSAFRLRPCPMRRLHGPSRRQPIRSCITPVFLGLARLLLCRRNAAAVMIQPLMQ